MTNLTPEQMFSIIEKFKSYNTVAFSKGGGIGATHLDGELYLPNIVRAVLCLKDGGAVTFSGEIEDADDDYNDNPFGWYDLD